MSLRLAIVVLMGCVGLLAISSGCTKQSTEKKKASPAETKAESNEASKTTDIVTPDATVDDASEPTEEADAAKEPASEQQDADQLDCI